MTFQEGDSVVLKGTDIHAQIVGVTSKGFDVVQYADYRIVRNVPKEELENV